MSSVINVYCDESCHLEHDGQSAAVFGAVWCADSKKREISERIKEIRTRHGVAPNFEFKWTKVSSSKVQMYMDLIDYFFDDGDIHFRCLVVPDKGRLDHEAHDQLHDDWYYKMFFSMLKVIFKPTNNYRVYLDIKDTRSEAKVQKLRRYLNNTQYEFSKDVIQRIQQVRSHEVAQLQLTDLLIGAMSYKARGITTSAAKNALVERIAKRSGYTLDRNTLLREEKFNIFVWQGSDQ